MFKKTGIKKRVLALILAVVMIFSVTLPASAKTEKKDNSLAVAQVFDKVWDAFADVVIKFVVRGLFAADNLGWLFKSNAFPTADSYLSQKHEYFYEGTDGKVQGESWKLGYSSEGFIPAEWRENAEGKADPEGMCLNKTYYFGGYFGNTVKDIYDNEQVYITVLSAGNDANGNGIDDVIILGAIDNIGVSNGNVRDIRAAVSDALCEKGIEKDDIVAFEFNATHAHTVIEALGMSLDGVFLTALGNHFLFRKNRAIEDDLYNSIRESAAKAAAAAYDSMEDGQLYYFETANANDFMKENTINNNTSGLVRDKLEYGADCQKFFACWYFEGESGTNTILANIGLHPTFANRTSSRVCGDVPYYMWKAMQDAGYQFMFIQGSQAAIGLSANYTQAGADWATENALTYEDWVARYGEKYAKKHFEGNKKEDGEKQYFNIRATGYTVAHFIIDSIDKSEPVAPVYDIKMEEILIPADYSIMYIAAVGGVFGYNTVKCPETETGYAIATEIGYVQLGENVVMLMLPGEVSPLITFGTDEAYTGDSKWQGEGSWNGTEWNYLPLDEYAKAALGEDKRVIAMGICNDEIGYVMPDTDTAENFLTKTFLANKDGIFGRADNEELMMASCKAGSALAEAYKNFFENITK